MPRPAVAVLLALLGACAQAPEKSEGSQASKTTPVPELPAGAPLQIVVAYGSEKKTWLEEAARAYDTSKPRTKSGRPIEIVLKAMGSGEAVQAIVSGELKANVFSPASGAYVALLNSAWMAKSGATKPICP